MPAAPGASFQDLCFKSNNECVYSNILEGFSPRKKTSWDTRAKILAVVQGKTMISDATGGRMDVEAVLGGLTKDDAGDITGATVITLGFLLKNVEVEIGGEFVDERAEAWEEKWLDVAEELEVRCVIERSFGGRYTASRLTGLQRRKSTANRNDGDFGEIAHAAFSRRPPICLDTIVARTRTTRKFGIRPSFKGHFLSRRAKPYPCDSQLLHRSKGSNWSPSRRDRTIFATVWTFHPHPTGSIAPLRDSGEPPPRDFRSYILTIYAWWGAGVARRWRTSPSRGSRSAPSPTSLEPPSRETSTCCRSPSCSTSSSRTSSSRNGTWYVCTPRQESSTRNCPKGAAA
jgi:hypothetical protein